MSQKGIDLGDGAGAYELHLKHIQKQLMYKARSGLRQANPNPRSRGVIQTGLKHRYLIWPLTNQVLNSPYVHTHLTLLPNQCNIKDFKIQ